MQLRLKLGSRFVGVMVPVMSVGVFLAGLTAPAYADLAAGPAYEGGRSRQPEKQQERRPPERRDDRQADRLDRRREHERGYREVWREERRHPPQIRRAPPVWRGDIRHFDRHDLPRWRNGYWRYTWHNNELAWWWIVGGFWYPYLVPQYPYPDPYVPYSPPVVIESRPVEPDPSTLLPAEPPAPMWYYCESAGAYYPYVSTCAEGWRSVPANPPAPVPAR